MKLLEGPNQFSVLHMQMGQGMRAIVVIRLRLHRPCPPVDPPMLAICNR